MFFADEPEAVGKLHDMGDSPVRARSVKDSGILSSAGHVKPCVNLAGPSAKAKYSWETDSEPVP
eukprot:CAMPEP_0170741286 /NCGR_PEP_ID=MMETSP0437-20130122/6139_1 /TAXON_ID=0 /ORGANISM="Sexangularia sp." /LENGTH=63 /DNA_ID=CAMNT_0011079849 /DNA_START=280 /DNA_END=472 /DNA_ORIENTATION=-